MEMKTDTRDGILNFYNLHHRHHLQIRMSAPLHQRFGTPHWSCSCMIHHISPHSQNNRLDVRESVRALSRYFRMKFLWLEI